jgi:hypothetical protein
MVFQEFNQKRALSAPVFASLTGTLTPSDTVTFVIGGTPPPFAVVFSDRSSGGQAITVTTVTATELSTTTGALGGSESEEIVSLVVPTLA